MPQIKHLNFSVMFTTENEIIGQSLESYALSQTRFIVWNWYLLSFQIKSSLFRPLGIWINVKGTTFSVSFTIVEKIWSFATSDDNRDTWRESVQDFNFRLGIQTKVQLWPLIKNASWLFSKVINRETKKNLISRILWYSWNQIKYISLGANFYFYSFFF